MKIETVTTKKLILTREEQRIIHDLYEIINKDNNLTMYRVWDILTDIYKEENNRAIDFGYDIEIVD